MKEILCFGDSNTYGLVPATCNRYPFDVRWTGLLSNKLGSEYNVVEEGLCGRTTIFDDKDRPYRNGSTLLPVLLESHMPLDLVIIMLGTNDCKTAYNPSPERIGEGIVKLIKQIRHFDDDTNILLISPIHLGEDVWKNEFDPEFNKASVKVSKGLKKVYQDIALKYNTSFLSASDYVSASNKDQEHLNSEGHSILADAIYKKVLTILEK